jgi:uncharacterized phage infection (PIP) family protein YhgE
VYKEKEGEKMTVEEIDIIVNASVEKALKEFEKIVPNIKKQMKQVQEAFSRIDTKEMQNKVQQAINFVKKKVQNLKQSSKNNEVAIKVNNKDAQKQISQIQKQIDSLQEKINARQMKLNVINPQIDKIVDETRKSVTPEGIKPNDKAMDTTVNNALESNKGFTSLNSQAQKLYTEIEMYNKQLSEAKNKMAQLEQEINQTATTQNKLGSFFSVFKQKTEQVKNNMSNMKNSFKSLPKVTQNIYNNIKGMGAGLKSGLGNVLKYATALFSLRSIYSALSSSAQSWLSSQNSQAKQLSANIEYMKYAMGSVFAPVIEYVTNLVYSLMKAVQSLVYAFSGVNIFAKATASSMKSASGSAKQTSKSLSSVHSEINNVSDNKNGNTSGTPNIDLSKVDKTPNKIIDVIKNGNWNEIGAMIGEKLNNALAKIPWDKIQSTAKNIASGIAQTLNGFIGTADWNQVGNTFAQGLNTAIYFAYTFVTTFDWKQFGQSIVDGINGFLDNFDWQTCGKTIGDFTKGLLDVIVVFIEQYDFQKFPNKIAECLGNIDWSGVAKRIFEILGAAIIKVSVIGAIINVGTVISNICNSAVEYFRGKIEECGGNVILGILKGIGDAIAGIGQWIYDNVFKPFIDGFKNAFGIHSPSTVMEEQGRFIIEGLKNGLTGIWEKVAGVFEGFGENVKTKFNEIKGNISDTWENVKSKTREKWENIKENVTETWENIKGKAKDKFDNIKSKVTDTWNNIKNDPNKSAMTTAIYNTFSDIKEKTMDKFDNIKSKISESWNKIKEDKKLSSMSDTIKNTFSGLGSSASVWGKDLVSNMAAGIKNNIHKVTTAVSSVANKIKSFLHFTEPDEGPLSNFHTYMPDMIDLMVSGIKSNTNKIKSEMENLAGTMSYTINTEAVTGIPLTNPTIKPVNVKANNMLDALSDIAYKENENNKPIYLTVNVGNAKLGQILLDNLRDMKRQSGKDIEALVGG